MKVLITICFVLISIDLQAQSLSIFDVDTTNFPTMKAKFFAFDKDGNQITNVSPSDFEIQENGQPRSVLSVSCPAPKPPQALSSVLVFDVSGSMSSGPPRIQSAKDAANAWVDGLPLGKSECALISFSDKSSILTDFTTNKQKLKKSINNLFPTGGTNYNQALIDLPCGGLQIAIKGKHKRVLIFLTDGQPNFEPKTSEIIQFAIANNITIYAVTLDMPAPQSIKDMTLQTGGQYFENITTLKEAQETYQKLLQVAQGGDPCEITWEGGVSCVAGMTEVELKHLQNGSKANTSFKTSFRAVAKLLLDPISLKFPYPEVGVKAEQKILLTARNADFTISNISGNNGGFEINPKNFNLKAGQSIELTASYFPIDSGYNYCKFEIENNFCPIQFYASGGWKGKKPSTRTLKLFHPNGSEKFIAGSDINITWDGVLPEEPVKIEYRTDDNQPWITISDSAKSLSHKFRVPKVESNKCLARVTALAKSGRNFDIEMELIPAGEFLMGTTGEYELIGSLDSVHKVTISRNFLMSKYEVTQLQYDEVMGENKSSFLGDDLPIQVVSWYDAIEFCNNLSDIEGLERCYSGTGTDIQCNWEANGYRLPTEAEWEYAARAGTTTDLYNGKLTIENLNKIAWWSGNSDKKVHPVGKKEPNSFGLFDMMGNVNEWCWDWDSYLYGTEQVDPKGSSSGEKRIHRGGNWDSGDYGCLSPERGRMTPNFSHNRYGFRVVLVP